MSESRNTYQIIIAGGGPVGLFLGCCLEYAGISCIVLEKRKEPITHSRSLGIHPVSMELFNKIGLSASFIEYGIKIKKGHAFSASRHIGTISFRSCPKPFNYILSLPQYKTEELLQEHLIRLNPDILRRGAAITGFREQKERVSVEYKKDGKKYHAEGDFLIGADGKDSLIRQSAGIFFKGFSYSDTYIMGDFSDNTTFGPDAAIFLPPQGLIESFPITHHMRRWVVKTDTYISNVTRRDIEQRIIRRIGHDLSGEKNNMLSSFGVQKLLAGTFVKNRVILVGDAAHIVSPIGGQGMNLGWIDAWQLSRTFLKMTPAHPAQELSLLRQYEQKQQAIARKAIRRAEFNMRLGRKSRFSFLKNVVIWILLNSPMHSFMARIFSMRRLSRGLDL